MNLISLQKFDYQFSCQSLDGLEDIKERWGLFMYCPVNSDVDSYFMDYNDFKTLHDNIERFHKILNKSLAKYREENKDDKT